ncbi:MAG: hypothetical protein J6Y02_17590 [Pseudobutyrivibrio sp.]|nr:hypothetical protein [Pseudobutyrivibrio sp.]
MLNKNFKRDLKIYAEANLLESEHFVLCIDTHWLALDIAIAPKLKMLRIQILCIIIDIF